MSSKLFESFATSTTYSGKSGQIHADPIRDEEHVQISRIVRAWAEVEDCLNLFICALAKITESQGLALLSKSGWSRKLDIARGLAELREDQAVEALEMVFTTGLSKIGKARNTVAHGVYLGRRDDGAMCFLTSDEIKGSEGPQRLVSVRNYNLQGLLEIADALEHSLPSMVSILQIEELREPRYTQSLRAHPKAQRRAPRKAE